MSNKKLGIMLLFAVFIFPAMSLAESSSSNGLVSGAGVSSSSNSLSKKEASQNTQ